MSHKQFEILNSLLIIQRGTRVTEHSNDVFLASVRSICLPYIPGKSLGRPGWFNVQSWLRFCRLAHKYNVVIFRGGTLGKGRGPP